MILRGFLGAGKSFLFPDLCPQLFRTGWHIADLRLLFQIRLINGRWQGTGYAGESVNGRESIRRVLIRRQISRFLFVKKRSVFQEKNYMKNWTAQFPKYSVELLCTVIFAYQKLFSPDHGLIGGFVGTGHCKFFPSCSAYAIGAIRQYGLLRGTVASFKRILRCNPWGSGGYDPVL